MAAVLQTRVAVSRLTWNGKRLDRVKVAYFGEHPSQLVPANAERFRLDDKLQAAA